MLGLSLGLTQGAILPGEPTVLSRAIAAWRVSQYGGSGDLLDITGHGHDARFGSIAGADTNDPLFLAHDGENYLRLSGVAGNYASTPAPALGGDFDLRIDVSLDDYTAFSPLIVSDTQAPLLQIRTGGTLQLYCEVAGGLADVRSAAILGFPPRARRWIRATYTAATGAAALYTSEDGEAWTPVAANVSSAASGALDASAVLRVGQNSVLSATPAGNVYRALVYSGINGILVADFDPSRSVEPHTSFVASTGETWTINRAASGRKAALVDRPLLLFGTDDYLEVPDHADFDLGAADDCTIVAFVRRFNAPGANQIILAHGQNDGGDLAGDGFALGFNGLTNTHFGTISDGVSRPLVSGSALVFGRAYGLALRRTPTDWQALVDGVQAASVVDGTGAIDTAFPLRMGRHAGASGGYADMEFIGAAIFREALSDEEIARLNVEFGV